MTDCSSSSMRFQGLGRREVVADFSGGTLTSDGGALLLREVDARLDLLSRFAGCFTDHRDPEHIEHTVKSLVARRVYGLALSYEDLNDHDSLRSDPLANCRIPPPGLGICTPLKRFGLKRAVQQRLDQRLPCE